MDNALPIHAVLPDLLTALGTHTSAVLIAPPGAGKTTAVAPALLDQPWCTGEIVLLSPRRVAARAAAERIADILGEPIGQRVGYLTRLDSRKGSRINVVTEAIFVNRILADEELSGISAVLFDEAHERHLDSDLGLALALETQGVLREDLRLLVMSATIDGTRFANLMDGAPVIESEGRAHPLRVEWLGASPERRLEDTMTSAILQAWREEQGDILAFLPGVGEIERVRERLTQRLPETPVLPLHGQVRPQDQRDAIRRDPEGRRRIVLATAIAETSITLDGVSVVVDSGLSRRAEFDRAAGSNHLVTVRASQASAAQRAGRAARQGPGVAYRLWEEGGHAGRPAFDPPEIATADLAPLVLSLAKLGISDPASLRWLDAPPAASLASARERLEALGALSDNRITPQGERIAALPMDPVSAATILAGAHHGQALEAAKLVLLLQERGLGGRGEDLIARLQRWNTDRSPRAEASRKLAERWAKAAVAVLRPSTGSGRAAGYLPETKNAARPEPVEGRETKALPLPIILAAARPDMLARRRDPSGENWQTSGGRGYRLDPASPLARADWLVIGDAQGQARSARITGAAQLTTQDIEHHIAHRIETRSTARWNEREGRAEARLERRIGAITLASGPDPDPDPAQLVDILVDKALEKLGEILPQDLLSRARFIGLDAFAPEPLRQSADLWLRPLLENCRTLDIPRGPLIDALLNLLPWDERQRLDTEAPRQFDSPAGTHHAIDYTGDDAPSVEVRVQALFGLDRHPMIGTTPLLLKLTSPAGRPVQSTRDLPGFWRGSWADVARDMKGRYPKHRWPDQPWLEKPSLKTKNAFQNSRT